ncbi:MAG: B12-binding domain-containing radical SAM protein [Chitinivibrionales bacterium]|nr:B12-binding domain-containing radical SAM protein [Chitinivibrionales bacterium]
MPPTALVINPWITDFKLYDEWMHPLGLYFLISLLRHNDYSVYYCNCLTRDDATASHSDATGRFVSTKIIKPSIYKAAHRYYKCFGMPEEQLTAYLKTLPGIDVIFIGSAMTYWLPGVEKTIRTVRAVFPTTPLVVGGTAVRLMPEYLQRIFPEVQIFSGSLFNPQDLSLSGTGPLRQLSIAGWTPDLSAVFSQVKFAGHGPLITSFGCPYACSYCASKFLFKRFLPRPQEIILKEFDALVGQYHVDHVALYDDALLHKADEHLLPLLDNIIRRNYKISIHVPNGMHAALIAPAIARALRAAGFKTIRLGYESGADIHKKRTCNKADKEVMRAAVACLKNAGFKGDEIGAYVMAGLPEQMLSEVIEEMDFVYRLGVFTKPVFFSPVPNTPLFNEYTQQFPQIISDPLWHNDTFFIAQLPGWDYESVQKARDYAKLLNSGI